MKFKPLPVLAVAVSLSACVPPPRFERPPEYIGGWAFGGGVGASAGAASVVTGSLEISKAWAWATLRKPVPVISFGSVFVGTKQAYWYGEAAIRGPSPLPSPTLGAGAGLSVSDVNGPGIHFFAGVPIPAVFLGDWIFTDWNLPYFSPFYRPRFSFADRTWTHEFGLQFKIFRSNTRLR